MIVGINLDTFERNIILSIGNDLQFTNLVFCTCITEQPVEKRLAPITREETMPCGVNVNSAYDLKQGLGLASRIRVREHHRYTNNGVFFIFLLTGYLQTPSSAE